MKKLKLGIAAASLAVFLLAPIASSADIVVSLDWTTGMQNGNGYWAGFNQTYDVTGVITNTSATDTVVIDSDSLAGPYDMLNSSTTTVGAANTQVQYDKDTDPFLNNLPDGGLVLAPGASSGDIQLVEVTNGPQYETPAQAFGPGGDQYAQDFTYGYFAVNDNVGDQSNYVTFATSTPEFSTVAMMMTGAGGLLGQLVRHRRSLKAAA